MIDRTGSFAIAHDLSVDRAESGALVAEQSQAQVLAENIGTLAPVLFERVAQPVTAGKSQATKLSPQSDPKRVEVVLASERHLAATWSGGDDAVAAAGELGSKLGASHAPAGTPAMLVGWFDLTRWSRIHAKETPEPDAHLPQVALVIAVKAGADQVTIESQVPLADIAQLLSRTSSK